MEKKTVAVDNALARFLIDDGSEKTAAPHVKVFDPDTGEEDRSFRFDYTVGDANSAYKPPHIHAKTKSGRIVKMRLTQPYGPLNGSDLGGVSPREVLRITKVMNSNVPAMEEARETFVRLTEQHMKNHPKTWEKRRKNQEK